MKKRILNISKNIVIFALLISIISMSIPSTAKAGWQEDLSAALQASTSISNIIINDPVNHPSVSNVVTYDDKTINEVKSMTDAGFKTWALKNLKIPSQAIINSVKVIPFTYELAYEDMNPYYAIIVNYLYTYSGLSLEDFAKYKYFVIIDYSGMNELGGYKRGTVSGIIGDGQSDLASSSNIYSIHNYLKYQIFDYSNQPQTTIMY